VIIKNDEKEVIEKKIININYEVTPKDFKSQTNFDDEVVSSQTEKVTGKSNLNKEGKFFRLI